MAQWWISPATCSGAVTEDIKCCRAPLLGTLAPTEPSLVPNTHTIESQPWWPPSSHHAKTITNPDGGREGLRQGPKARLRRNELVSGFVQTALMTKQLKNTFWCISSMIKKPCVIPRHKSLPGPGSPIAWKGEDLLGHLLQCNTSQGRGLSLRPHRKPLQDPPLRTVFLPTTQTWAGNTSVKCSGVEAPSWFMSASVATTLPITEAPWHPTGGTRQQQELQQMMLPDRSQPG